MAPSTSTSPLSRLLLSLPKPSNAQPLRCVQSPSTDSGVGGGNKNLVLRRREAAAAVLSTALSRVLPAVAAETDVASAAAGECALETTPSGLAFCDRVVGTGAEAVKGQLIKAHYRGMLEDGTVFDSSYGRGRPLTIMVGAGSQQPTSTAGDDAEEGKPLSSKRATPPPFPPRPRRPHPDLLARNADPAIPHPPAAGAAGGG